MKIKFILKAVKEVKITQEVSKSSAVPKGAISSQVKSLSVENRQQLPQALRLVFKN